MSLQKPTCYSAIGSLGLHLAFVFLVGSFWLTQINTPIPEKLFRVKMITKTPPPLVERKKLKVKTFKKQSVPVKPIISSLPKHDLKKTKMVQKEVQQATINSITPRIFKPIKFFENNSLKAIKKAGIRAGSGFMIGFPDESWESIVKTKEFVKELFAEGLDQAGFAIPVPYPGTLDFEREMKNPEIRKNFNENLLEWTDQMHIRGRPLFPTKIPAADLEAAVKDFWEEVNSSEYVDTRSSMNIKK